MSDLRERLAAFIADDPSVPIAMTLTEAAATADALLPMVQAERDYVLRGVRAWCSINEIAAPPLDWAGLGEFLAHCDAAS